MFPRGKKETVVVSRGHVPRCMAKHHARLPLVHLNPMEHGLDSRFHTHWGKPKKHSMKTAGPHRPIMSFSNLLPSSYPQVSRVLDPPSPLVEEERRVSSSSPRTLKARGSCYAQGPMCQNHRCLVVAAGGTLDCTQTSRTRYPFDSEIQTGPDLGLQRRDEPTSCCDGFEHGCGLSCTVPQPSSPSDT